MSATETYAGMLARTYPELGQRELSALNAENTRVTYRDGSSAAERTIADRAEDAADLARQAAHELALAGRCSHGGHGYDGETCSDIPV